MPQPPALRDAGRALPAAASLPVLVVDAGGHRCAVPIAAVVEIHPAVRLADLPAAPEVVVGLLNRHGTALPVLSLRRRLRLADRSVHLDDHLVVLRLPDRQVALLVDAAVDVRTVPLADVDVAATSGAAHSHGVAVLPDGLLVVVDLATFLSLDEGALLDRSLAALPA